MPLWRRGLLVCALLCASARADGGVVDLLHEIGIPGASTIASALAAGEITDAETVLLLDADTLRHDFPSISAGVRLKILKYVKQQQPQSASASDCVSEARVRALIAEEGGRSAAPVRPQQPPSRELQSGGAPPDGVTGASAWFKADAAKVVFGSTADCALERKHPGDLVSSCPLHAGAGVKIGPHSGASCSNAGHGGFVRYNPSEQALELCDGEEWGAVGSGSGAFAAADGETCDETTGGALQFDKDKVELTFCDGTEWRPLFTAGVGDTAGLAVKDCQAIYDAGQRDSGLYWVKPGDADAVKVYCQMTIDGGGWTTCASQNFNLAGPSSRLGTSQLSSVWGDDGAQVPSPTSTGWGADCAYLMEESAKDTGGKVELLMFNAEVPADWTAVYPFDAPFFRKGLTDASDFPDGNCHGPKVKECKGSDYDGKKAVDLSSACHWNGGHRTTDNYHIYQVSGSQNGNVLLEIGQGDPNHPVAFRSDCSNDGMWSGCSQTGSPALSKEEWNALRVDAHQRIFAYQSHPQCSRMDGPVMLAYRARAGLRSCADILAEGHTNSGVFSVDPLGTGDIDVYCDLPVVMFCRVPTTT